jgi:excisionase family DNA binding protein
MAEQAARPRQMLLTVPEAAELLGVSEWLIWKLVWNGQLPSTRVGRLVRLYLREVEAYLERNRRRVE